MHPSLSGSKKGAKNRGVLKRFERIKTMIEKEQWKEGDRMFGLPKIKAVRIKIKKEKAEKAVEGAAAAPEAGAAPAAAAKAPAKEAKK
jgi:small basic protein (TIGR04137 family)